MKTIGVIGAMPEEVSLLKSRMVDVESEKVAGLEIFKGQLHGRFSEDGGFRFRFPHSLP